MTIVMLLANTLRPQRRSAAAGLRGATGTIAAAGRRGLTGGPDECDSFFSFSPAYDIVPGGSPVTPADDGPLSFKQPSRERYCPPGKVAVGAVPLDG